MPAEVDCTQLLMLPQGNVPPVAPADTVTAPAEPGPKTAVMPNVARLRVASRARALRTRRNPVRCRAPSMNLPPLVAGYGRRSLSGGLGERASADSTDDVVAIAHSMNCAKSASGRPSAATT